MCITGLACASEGSRLVVGFYCASEKKVAYGFVAFERYVVISLKFELFKDEVFEPEVVWVVGRVSEIRLRLFLQSVFLSFLMHLFNAGFSCADHSIRKVRFSFLFFLFFFFFKFSEISHLYFRTGFKSRCLELWRIGCQS